MFFRMIKMLCKLFGMACIVGIVREKLGVFAHTFQHNLQTKAKKIIQIFLLGSLVFILLGLGLRFLLLGLAYWLNTVFSSAYLGFFLVSIFCFLMVMFMVLMLRNKISSQEADQGHMKDGA
ncbi:phage holin family protein [Cardinium endosymbiont of Philonthus spinipes]|uniref:phage holin family protein n=1 Tax=Cardinium endosymbiont of Philonthus spinipes TaxID=3077941 RepID=UPI00313E6F80